MANGLFSMPTPAEVRQNAINQIQNYGLGLSQLPAGRGAVALAGQAGGLLGRAAGQAAGGVDPNEQRAAEFQGIQQQVQAMAQEQNWDLSKPEDQIKMLGESAKLMGNFPQQQAQAMAMMNDIRKTFQSTSREDADSGLFFNPNTMEVAGSGARGKLGTLYEDAAGLVDRTKKGELLFVRGDSPLAQQLKQASAVGTDEISKKEMAAISDSYELAIRREPTVQQMVSIVNSPGFDSGRVDAFILPLQEIASEFGWELPKNAQDLGKMSQLLEQEVLNNIGYQKGNLNLQELQSIQKLTGQIKDPTEKLKTTVMVSDEIIKRQKLRKERADAYLLKNKKITGFAKEWNKYIGSKPMTKVLKKDGVQQTLVLPEAEMKWRNQFGDGRMQEFYDWWAK